MRNKKANANDVDPKTILFRQCAKRIMDLFKEPTHLLDFLHLGIRETKVYEIRKEDASSTGNPHMVMLDILDDILKVWLESGHPEDVACGLSRIYKFWDAVGWGEESGYVDRSFFDFKKYENEWDRESFRKGRIMIFDIAATFYQVAILETKELDLREALEVE